MPTRSARSKSGKPASRRAKYKVGSIIALPLPDGRYAFAKVFENFDLGVYDLLAQQIEPVDKVKACTISFFQTCTDRPITSGEWPVIGEEPFPDEESAWGPPRVTGAFPGMEVDPMFLQIEHKGTGRNATVKEVKGLEFGSICQTAAQMLNVIQERLIEGKHDEYRIKV